MCIWFISLWVRSNGQQQQFNINKLQNFTKCRFIFMQWHINYKHLLYMQSSFYRSRKSIISWDMRCVWCRNGTICEKSNMWCEILILMLFKCSKTFPCIYFRIVMAGSELQLYTLVITCVHNVYLNLERRKDEESFIQEINRTKP